MWDNLCLSLISINNMIYVPAIRHEQVTDKQTVAAGWMALGTADGSDSLFCRFFRVSPS
jgi:hypothetical protein